MNILHMKYAKEFGVEAELCQYKELLGYMARHHEDLEKTFTDEQKETFEKFHVAKSKTIEYRF